VEALPSDEEAAKRSCVTGDSGQFELDALPDGDLALNAHSEDFGVKVSRVIHISGSDIESRLQLKPVFLKNTPKTVHVLGMVLTDMTPELQALYDQDEPTGVLILDPGAGHGLIDLRKGERFWIVGNKVINNLPEMVDELLRINDIDPPGTANEGCRGRVRIVYVYRNGLGTMTSTINLGDDDVLELKHLSNELKKGDVKTGPLH
jgi:hypothetical protein